MLRASLLWMVLPLVLSVACASSTNYRQARYTASNNFASSDNATSYEMQQPKCDTNALRYIVKNNPSKFKELKVVKDEKGVQKTKRVMRDTKGLVKLIRQAARQRTPAQYELASYLLYNAPLQPEVKSISSLSPRCSADNEELEDGCLSDTDSQTIIEQSFCLASQAAHSEHAEAQFLLCQMYDRGVGTEKDYAAAVQWCKVAFHNGYAEAGYWVASSYLNGDGVEKDKDLAFDWLQQAAHSGHRNSQIIIARECAERNSKWCDKDIDTASYWLLKLVNDAQEFTATKQDDNKHTTTAFHWFAHYIRDARPQLSAKKENAIATKAVLQSRGIDGIGSTPILSMARIKNLALLMGMAHAFGWGGTTVDYEAALKWFQKVHRGGLIFQGAANFNLAFMYASKWIDFNSEKATLHFTNYITQPLGAGAGKAIISSHISEDSMRTEHQHVVKLYIKTLATTARRIVEAKNRLAESSKDNKHVSDYALSRELGYTDALLDVSRVKQKLYSAAEAFRWGQCTWAENFCVTENKARSEQLYRMAAQLEHREAKQLIASLKGINLADKDLDTAAKQLCVGSSGWGPFVPYVRSELDNVQHMDIAQIYHLYKSRTGGEIRILSDQQIFKMCNKFAQLGHVGSQMKLAGFLSSIGATIDDVSKNDTQAFYWVNRVADSAKATVEQKIITQYNLSLMYKYGLGVSKNYKKYHFWALKSARGGYRPSQWDVVFNYHKGRGTKINHSKEVYWLKKIVAQKSEQDFISTYKEYFVDKPISVQDEAADENNENTQASQRYNALANSHLQSLRNRENVLNLAQHRLAWSYANGECGLKKNTRKALKWAELAWENGAYEAGFLLGDIYANGGAGVPADHKQAVQWWQKAWTKMNSEEYKSQYTLRYPLSSTYLGRIAYRLGEAYNDGLGVFKNYRKAHQWYLKAAQQGLFQAQYSLADLYLNADKKLIDLDEKTGNENKGNIYVGDKNKIKAYAWLNVAANCSPKRCTDKQRKLIKKWRDQINLYGDDLNTAQALSEQLLATSSEDFSQSETH